MQSFLGIFSVSPHFVFAQEAEATPTPVVTVTVVPEQPSQDPPLLEEPVVVTEEQTPEPTPTPSENLNLEPQETSEPSAQLNPLLSTDKDDYPPTGTVILTGKDFPTNTELTVKVTWPDGKIRDSSGELEATDKVKTDESGSLTFFYPLRGEGQEGEYLVEVLNGGTLIVTTSFTDSANGFIKFDSLTPLSGAGPFTVVGGWDPQGNNCNHFWIELHRNSSSSPAGLTPGNSSTLLASISPAPCDTADHNHPHQNPPPGDLAWTSTFTPTGSLNNEYVCALLIHSQASGQDLQASVCFGQPVNPPSCGNGVMEGNEQCDDGNLVNGDGCSSTCQTESPSERCGDGIINGNEQCDDGNSNNGDGCSAACQDETPPTVSIDHDFARIINDQACGIGSAWSDDGIKAVVENWLPGYTLQGGYKIAGGSYGDWINLVDGLWGNGSLTVSGTTATYTLMNTGDSPEGPAGWEIRVFNSAGNEFVPPVQDALEYTITNDLTSEVCGGGPVCVEGPTWASEVDSNLKGTLKNGNPIIDPARTDPNRALGADDGQFYSLGKNGWIVLTFPSFVTDGSGADLLFHEVTWGRLSYPMEKALVEVSQDKLSWVSLGEIDNKVGGTGVAAKDLAGTGLTWIKYVRIKDTSDFSLFDNTGDGYDLDAVKANYGVCQPPEPVCGNEIREGNEECDDGNQNNNDSCLNSCRLATCGDEFVWEGHEQCDGSASEGYRCTDNCTLERLPYCGDGTKQEPEKCDGTDGITKGENFCSTSCKLIPIYDGGHVCPDGTVRSNEPVLTRSVLGNDVDGESFTLTAGGKYLFEATGTFVPTSATGYVSDAGYTLIDGIKSGQYGIQGTPPDYAAHALLANLGGGVGVVDWGDYNPDHVYSKYYQLTNADVQFVIGDRYSDWFNTPYQDQSGMGDNSGNLTLNVYECQPEPVTINAAKVICDQESDLPNWGNHGAVIGANTAQDYVNNHQSCRIAENWDFQWGPAGAGRFDSFQTNTSPLGNPWNTFSGTALINNVSSLGGRIEVREVFPDNNYLPFSGNDNNNVSAEFYCTGDVYHYDNWEWINNPEYGQTYYCVAFNALNKGSVLGMKYEDMNGDGDRNGGENGLSDWTIELKQGDTVLRTTKTDTDGLYSFQDVIAGDYEVCEESRDGWVTTDPFENVCRKVTVAAGQNTLVDFGNFKLGKISGYKFKDINDDGVWDKTGNYPEPGIEGWKICLNQEICRETNADGYYEFTKLTDGTYTISEENREGWRQTLPGETGTYSVLINSGTEAIDKNFGNAPPISLHLNKTNDHLTAHAGDTITYTLTTTVDERALSLMGLMDVLPEGFTYVAGTATVTGGTVNSVEPAIIDGKILTWTWTFVPGSSTVTVTYQVKISSDNQASSYTNLAYVHGLGSPTEVESGIVESEVRIDPVDTNSAPVGGSQVLGASTELPAAGTNTWFLLLGLGMIGSGFGLKVKTQRRKH